MDGTVVDGTSAPFRPTDLGPFEAGGDVHARKRTFEPSDRVKIEWGTSQTVFEPTPVDVGLAGVR